MTPLGGLVALLAFGAVCVLLTMVVVFLAGLFSELGLGSPLDWAADFGEWCGRKLREKRCRWIGKKDQSK